MSADATTPVILSACRTPIGKYLGGLAPLPALRLGAIVIREAVRRAGIDAARVDEVILGNVLQGGVGQAPARQAAIHAGLPGTIPSVTINKVCGSGLKAVMLAAQAIKAGDEQCVVAGGVESMAHAPHYVYGMRGGLKGRENPPRGRGVPRRLVGSLSHTPTGQPAAATPDQAGRGERARRHVARFRPGAWPQGPRSCHGVRHGGRRSAGSVLRPDRRGAESPGAGEDQDLGLRPDRGERGVRGAGARRRACPRVGLGARQRERRRHPPRPSDRRLGRARPHDALVCPQGQAADNRTRHPVSRSRQCRGPQRGDALMPEAQTVALSSPPRALAARRALAVLLGAALVAAAAQVSLPLPGTPVPMTLQPLAVLVVGGLLGAPLGAASLLLYLALGAAGLPVFTPFGVPEIGRLFGPTGGHLLAYPLAAFAVGRIAGDAARRGRTVLGVLAGLALIHLGGLAQLLLITGSLRSAVQLGTVPFLLGDLGKVAIAVLLLQQRTVRPVRARL